MELLSGADMIARFLQDEGVEYIYGYPGGAALHIYDALFRQDKVKHILVRHEQAATHAADGYARASGKPGVVLNPVSVGDVVETALSLFVPRFDAEGDAVKFEKNLKAMMDSVGRFIDMSRIDVTPTSQYCMF